MIYHQAKDPDSYQTIFYKQIGLKRQSASLPENDWANDQIGSIYTYGRMDSIQFGIGDYTIPEDFLLNFNTIPNICMPVSSTRASPTLSLKIVWEKIRDTIAVSRD